MKKQAAYSFVQKNRPLLDGFSVCELNPKLPNIVSCLQGVVDGNAEDYPPFMNELTAKPTVNFMII
ncbi:MAG: hypothetical protein K0R67_2911 [Paenibacillus sp.]|jgi:hypothetical protein|nr:hypothetical protein [Paenibacillus sp.]